MGKRDVVHICQFDSAEHLRGRARTYKAVRAAVVEAGRFSVFEATASQKSAVMFMTLERDPDVVVERTMPFPWVGPIRWRGTGTPVPAPRKESA